MTSFTDPDALSFENGNRVRKDKLTPEYQTKLTCIVNKVTAAGAKSTLTSAWRPSQYQRHLKEIVTKDQLLTPSFLEENQACRPLRGTVTAEMSKHGLKPRQPVGAPGLSKHESGQAFDLTPSGLTNAQYQIILDACGAVNSAVKSEPWHIQ